jgi:osmotically-inducible protein OsmY
MRLAIFATFIALIVMLSSGCVSDRQKDEPKPALRALGESVKPGDTVSNRDLGFEFRRRLNDNPAETIGVIVEVDDGNVTLRGSAPNLAAAWRAEAAARSVKGVKQVLNQIIVAGSIR